MTTHSPSLYDRLGGVYSIATVIDAPDWAPLVPARPLAAALVIETALMPFAR